MTIAANNVFKAGETPPVQPTTAAPDLPWEDAPGADEVPPIAAPPAQASVTDAITKAAGKAPAERKGPPQNVVALLTDPRIKAQIALAMPKHMTAERLARIALTEVRKVPALGKCDPASFLGAIMQCAALGLEPGGSLGHAYILPFNRRSKVDGQWKTVSTDAQFILGYRGMIDLARRSGQIVSLESRAVYKADKFRVELGLHPTLEHTPAWDAEDRGLLTFVYAVARLVGGGVQFEVMSRVDIERVKAQSKAASDGPWVSHFEEMAKKTVIRRLFKYLPVSIEVQRAIGLDEQAEAGVAQDNPMLDALTVDIETGEISGGAS
jgi:recombination protein RecT